MKNLDRRIGIWTKITYTDNAVTFHRTKAYTFGRWIGIISISVILFNFGGLLTYSRDVGLWLCGFIIVVILLLFLLRIIMDKPGQVIAIVYDEEDVQQCEHYDGCILLSKEISKIEIRENDCRHPEDAKVIQMWLYIRGKQLPIIVHQRYFIRRDKLLEIASKLSTRWNVPLVVNCHL